MVSEGLAYFVSGKFDQFSVNDPYSVFVSAFSDLCDLMYQSDDIEVVRKDISIELKDDVHSLIRLIPSMYLVTGMTDEVGGTKTLCDENSLIKFQLTCRKFLQIMAKRKPVVLFFDDWQWADTAARALLASFLEHDELWNVLFVCAHRDNFEFELPLRPCVTSRTCMISVRNLDLGSINQIVSQLTYCDPMTSKDLSQVVFNKTAGNPYYALRYLESLVTDRLVVYTDRSGKWTWNLDQIQARTNVSDNVIGVLDLVSTKIRRIPVDAQELLKVAALLGFSFNVRVLTLIVENSLGNKEDSGPDVESRLSSSIAKHLETASQEGLVEIGKAGEMKFTHDRVHQCLVMMLNTDQRVSLHLRIGRTLWHSLADASEDWLVLLATDQVDRGVSLLNNPKEAMGIVELNLRASRVATSKSAFEVAMKCLRVGMMLLKKFLTDPWGEEYALCHALFFAGAEVGISSGALTEGEEIVDEVIRNSQSKEEKLHAYCCKVKIAGVLGRSREAIDVAISVLRENGQRFPKKPSAWHVVLELLRTKRWVRRMKDDEFMSLPLQNDATRKYEMNLMSCIVSRAQMVQDKESFTFACCRMVRSSIKHGLLPRSLHGLAKFGMILSILGATSEAYRIGRLVMRLLDRFEDSSDLQATSIISVYGFLNHLRQPLKDGRYVLKRAYQAGMRIGDAEWALFAAAYNCMMSISYGDDLSDAASFMREIIRLSRAFKVELPQLVVLGYYQVAQNLLGDSDNPAVLLGEAMDEFDKIPGSREGLPLWVKKHGELMIGCYLEEWEYAQTAWEEIQKKKVGGSFVKAHFVDAASQFFAGVMYFARFRETGKRVYLTKAKRIITISSRNVKEGMTGFVPVLCMMLAEKASLSSRNEHAIRVAYDSAIVAATQADMANFAGLVCEMAGRHFSNTSEDVAEEYFQSARDHYFCLGSPVLVSKIEKIISRLLAGRRKSSDETFRPVSLVSVSR